MVPRSWRERLRADHVSVVGTRSGQDVLRPGRLLRGPWHWRPALRGPSRGSAAGAGLRPRGGRRAESLQRQGHAAVGQRREPVVQYGGTKQVLAQRHGALKETCQPPNTLSFRALTSSGRPDATSRYRPGMHCFLVQISPRPQSSAVVHSGRTPSRHVPRAQCLLRPQSGSVRHSGLRNRRDRLFVAADRGRASDWLWLRLGGRRRHATVRVGEDLKDYLLGRAAQARSRGRRDRLACRTPSRSVGCLRGVRSQRLRSP